MRPPSGLIVAGVLALAACGSKESPKDSGTKTEGKGDAKAAEAGAVADAKTDAEADAEDGGDAGGGSGGATPDAGEPEGPVYLVGKIEIPGSPLEYQATLEAGDPPSGTIDIPMQGANGVALQGVHVSAKAVEFALANGAKWKGTIADDGSIACEFEQGGAKLSCEMKQVDAAAFAAAGPKRPQTPAPPFPYETEDIEWDASDGVHLAGTIARPKGAGPHPAVVLVSGSGQQDRDESIMGHRPFAVLADRLARAGVASLRYDDRGAGKSTGDVEALTITLEAGDAESALDQLRAAEGIDPARVGIVGHSVGGIIAPMVASKRPDDVAFAVLLAGSGVKGSELHARQVEALMTAQKLPQAALDAAKAGNEAMYAVIAKGGSDDEIKEVLGAAGLAGPALDAQAKMVASPWFREFLTMDPTAALKKTKCPVLVLGGTLDLQVVAEQNVPAIEAALKAGGNTKVESHTFPGLNHLFQPAKLGTPDEYATIEITMDEAALAKIESWIVATTKP